MMNAPALTNHERSVLCAVADGKCFVVMSHTLMNLGDYGVLEFDATLPIPWRVTANGFEALAIGDVEEDV